MTFGAFRSRLTTFVRLRSIQRCQKKFLSSSDETKNTSTSLLNQDHQDLAKRIKNVLMKIQSDMPILSKSDRQLINEAQSSIESIFLLVVVGEFNSGKSQFINTLLGVEEEICPTGVLPTTDLIHIIRYGPQRKEKIDSEHIKSIYVPNQWLKQTNIVDTPGTNAILQTHQQITEHFIPKSDYILFVTSVDRPFSESERLFLVRIHQWRKKVLIILNKIDQISDNKSKNKIVDYVRHNACQVLEDANVPIFPISALKSVGFKDLHDYLRSELNDEAKIRLKLENPLGIADHILDQYLKAIEERRKILQDDEQAVKLLKSTIDGYRKQILEDFQYQTNKIDNIFFRMIDKMEEFLNEFVQISRLIPTLFSSSGSSDLKFEFNNRVNKNVENDINQSIIHLCDWMLDRSHRTLQQLYMQVHANSIKVKRQQQQNEEENSNTRIPTNVNTEFAQSHQQILTQLKTQCENILYKKNTSTSSQADELTTSIRSTMLGTAAIEVGAVGFGTLAALASFDWTGFIGASLLGVLGLYFIPMRRSQIKHDMKHRIDQTRIELLAKLTQNFNIEIENNERKMREVITPYVRFVEVEKGKLTETTQQIENIRLQIKQIKLQIHSSLKHQNTKQ